MTSSENAAVRPSLFLDSVTSVQQGKGRLATARGVRDFSLLVQPGEALGLLGTKKDAVDSIIALALGVLRPQRGTVYTDGQPCGITPATAFLLDETLEYNMIRAAMAQNINGAALRSATALVAQEAGVVDRLKSPVRDCEPETVERVRLCLALATGPSVLVVDEPEASGRALTEEEGAARLQAFRNHGGTVVVASQNARLLAKVCDRTLWMIDGEPVMDADAAKVSRRHRQLTQAERDRDRALVRQLRRRYRSAFRPASYIVQERGRRKA